jgi:hypothetical protein
MLVRAPYSALAGRYQCWCVRVWSEGVHPAPFFAGSWYSFMCEAPGSFGGGDWDARSITMLVACGVVVAVAVGCTLAVYMRESLIELKADLEYDALQLRIPVNCKVYDPGYGCTGHFSCLRMCMCTCTCTCICMCMFMCACMCMCITTPCSFSPPLRCCLQEPKCSRD